MKQPAYHLRPNKAVDRLTLIDVLRRSARLMGDGDLSDCTYYGLGGAYLGDFELIYEFYPEMRMVCVEEDEKVRERQSFHAPCNGDKLEFFGGSFTSFLAQLDPSGRRGVFWADYTDLSYGHFEDFTVMLQKAVPNSLVKISLRCQPTDYTCGPEERVQKRTGEFCAMFQDVLPHSAVSVPSDRAGLAKLLQDMVQIAAEKALPGASETRFAPISSFHYADGAGMFTITGMVCLRADEGKVRKTFEGWPLANLSWQPPREIDVPTLSTRERLHIQRRLPCGTGAGAILREALGHLIDPTVESTEAKLQQYADYHRYFPYFLKGAP